MPALSADEVARFVALGEEGERLWRAGDSAGAKQAFRAQLSICPLNYEPWLALALVEAASGSEEAAVDHLRSAVLRGFRDLRGVERAEAWTRMPRSTAFLKLVDAIPAIAKAEREWPGWRLTAERTPDDLDVIESEHARLVARIDAMSPALGPRMTALWDRLIESALAVRLETFVARHPDAPGLEAAVGRLMSIYAAGPLQEWSLLPAEAVPTLTRVTHLVLERFPASPMRPSALLGLALAWNTERDRRGVLTERALAEVRSRLGEVVEQHAGSDAYATAVVGLVRTEAEVGRIEQAAARYAAFRDRAGSDRALADRVRGGLGDLALRLGGVPDFRAVTLDGTTVGAETLRGKVAVIDFWATWCGPCLDGFDDLRRIAGKHPDEVVVLGFNLDGADEISEADLREWIAREALPGEHVHDGLGWESDVVRAFGVTEIPFTAVVGPDGAVLAINEGRRQMEKAVLQASRVATPRR